MGGLDVTRILGLELMVYPAIYEVWRGWQLRKAPTQANQAQRMS